jgi:nitrogen regulatory protein P-II 1
MKKIEAIICPSAFDAVHQALDRRGVGGMTVSEVVGVGVEPARAGSYRGASFTIDSVPRLRLEIVVPDPAAGPLAHTIADAVRTCRASDALITIRDVEQAIRVRTGERGAAAVATPSTAADFVTDVRPGPAQAALGGR